MKQITFYLFNIVLLTVSVSGFAQNRNTSIRTAIPELKATNYVGNEYGQKPSESVLRHSEDSHGHNGTYIRVTFPKHPSEKANLLVYFSFMIEKDPFNPKYPTQGSVKNINWEDLKPLSFQVTEDGRVFYGYKEDGRSLKTTTDLVRKRTNWDSFDVYVPWELFSLGYLFDTPEKQSKGCFPINIFLKADVYQNMKHIGTNQNIPVTRYVYDVPSSGMEIKDLGSEDISSLFDEDPQKPPIPKFPPYVARDSAQFIFVPTGGGEPTGEQKNDTIPRPQTISHSHHFTSSIGFGTPIEVKSKRGVKYTFPQSVTMNIEKNSVVFKKAESDIGENIYIGQFSIEVRTMADVEQYIAHLNDSLKNEGEKVSLRLPTMKEVSKVTKEVVYNGEENFEYYFNPDKTIFLALEYNKGRTGTAVVTDYVKVIETHTQKCSCGEKRVFSYTRQFKSMLLCRLYMNKKK